MSTYNSRSSGGRGGSGRSSGRGPRRDNDRRGGGSDRRDSERSPFRPAETKAPAKKPSFWEKVIGLFTGKKTNGSAGSGSPARTPRPEYRSGSTGTTAAGAPAREVRKPEAVEVTSPKLYVGNLSFDATESDLAELFNGVGAVQSAEIVSHKETERSKGFGFVTMSAIDEAKRAVSELHDKEFMGRKLVVSGAKTPVDRG